MSEVEGSCEEHSRWREEHAEWLNDVDRWQNDHQEAVFDLDRLQALVMEYGDAVREHSNTIVLHERMLTQDEHEPADFRGNKPPGNPAVTKHRHLGAKHEQVREAHERIRKHHETVVTLLRTLVAAMRDPL